MNLNDLLDLDLILKDSRRGTTKGEGIDYRNKVAQLIAQHLGLSHKSESGSDYPRIIINKEYCLFVKNESVEIYNKNYDSESILVYKSGWSIADLIDEILSQLASMHIISSLHLLCLPGDCQ